MRHWNSPGEKPSVLISTLWFQTMWIWRLSTFLVQIKTGAAKEVLGKKPVFWVCLCLRETSDTSVCHEFWMGVKLSFLWLGCAWLSALFPACLNEIYIHWAISSRTSLIHSILSVPVLWCHEAEPVIWTGFEQAYRSKLGRKRGFCDALLPSHGATHHWHFISRSYHSS